VHCCTELTHKPQAHVPETSHGLPTYDDCTVRLSMATLLLQLICSFVAVNDSVKGSENLAAKTSLLNKLGGGNFSLRAKVHSLEERTVSANM
jgi:hypothetical protein